MFKRDSLYHSKSIALHNPIISIYNICLAKNAIGVASEEHGEVREIISAANPRQMKFRQMKFCQMKFAKINEVLPNKVRQMTFR